MVFYKKEVLPDLPAAVFCIVFNNTFAAMHDKTIGNLLDA